MKSTITKLYAPIVTIIISMFNISFVNAAKKTTTKTGDVCNSKASSEVKAASGCPGYGTGDDLPNVIVNILNAIIGVAGLISVIWIIIGGVNYMTSSGDSTKTKKARDTILYACIGLAVCVLAFAIVNFVISNILKKA